MAIPTQPTNLNFTSSVRVLAATSTDVSILVAWTDVSADEDGFRIEWSRESDFSVLDGHMVGAPGCENVTIKNLFYNETYYVRVYSYNSGGDTAVTVTSPVTTLPDIPLDLAAAEGAEPSEVDLTWSAPVGPNVGASSYVVEYKLSSASTWVEFASGVTDLFDTVTGLFLGLSYDFRVTGTNAAGNGASSIVASASTGAGAASIFVEWVDASSDEDGFRIEWSRQSDFSILSGTDTVAAGVEEYLITGVGYSTLYYIRAYSYNGDGDSLALSGSVTTSPAQVEGLAAAQGSSAPDIDLTWDAVTGATGYKIEYKLTADSSWGVFAEGVTDAFDTVTGLVESTNYDFQVRAQGEGGNGVESDTESILTN